MYSKHNLQSNCIPFPRFLDRVRIRKGKHSKYPHVNLVYKGNIQCQYDFSDSYLISTDR